MRIVEKRALRGPNYYHRLPVIFMHLDLEELEYTPSDTDENLFENLQTMLPSLIEHTCSPRVRGGFFQRVKRGTWAGHIAEHIAIELQNLIGHSVTFGKTFTKKPKGNYHMVYRYLTEEVGLRAGEMAVDITNKLFQGISTEIDPLLDELIKIEANSKLGPSTQSIVDEATRRGIPYSRLNDYSYIQLGNGKYQRCIEATLMDDTSALGVEIAADKQRTKRLLEQHGIPVPKGMVVSNLEEVLSEAKTIGYPVVLKPLSGNHGRGVIVNIENSNDLTKAFNFIEKMSHKFIIEKYLTGYDFRLMVINYKLEAAALRLPAFVKGNGKSTIHQLIQELNTDPRRGDGHEKVLTRIQVDEETERVLMQQGYDFETVLETEKIAYVKGTANISSGGSAIDVTDSVHPSVKIMAERAARIIGLNVMGIDLIAKSLEQPLSKDETGVVEVNAGPGFRMHLSPSHGSSRNIAKPVVDMLFPERSRHSVPICAVTGTNGKTTTTRLISHILANKGHVVGMTNTDAVVINNTVTLGGDYSGPGGAAAVLADKTVEYAVLEVARGGILRRGLGFPSCDVGVLLNVSSDHLGLGGIETLEELTRLKSVVPESVTKEGYAVYNADDELVMSRSHKTKGKRILFSLNINNPYLIENLSMGNINITILDGHIVIQKEFGMITIGEVAEFPITFEGHAQFNIQNVLAAIGACLALGMEIEDIYAGLVSFSPSIGQSPGRMNMIDIGEFKVVVDYGHNPGAIRSTGEFFKQLMPGRKIRLASGVGDRREEDIIDYGRAVAEWNDLVVLCDSCPRTRKKGETAELVTKGLQEAGMDSNQIHYVENELEATKAILNMAQAGDLIVIQADNIARVTKDIFDFKQAYLANK